MTNMISAPTWERAVRLAKKDGYPDVSSMLDALFDREEMIDEELEDSIAAIREGLDDAANGRARPAREALLEIAKKYGIEV
jgi:predicted transcriptional regulator